MRFLEYYFWITPDLLLLAVVYVMLRRRMYVAFPFFFSCIVFELARSAALLLADTVFRISRSDYKAAVAFSLGVSVLLRLGVIYELVGDMLALQKRPSPRLRNALNSIFALLVLASAGASATQIRSGAEGVENVFLSVELLWSLLMCGAVLALFVFGRRMRWRKFSVGIALGFGIFAAINLATSAFRSEFNLRGNLAISIVQMAAYHICVLVWLVYLFLPEQRSAVSASGLRKAKLEAWNDELQNIVR